jgi:glycosyltransferase involved in cell wall biosynthesis
MNNTQNPLISVCLTTYNHEKYIEEAIYSILAQTFKDYELIIVNDGSTDETDSIIKRILQRENNPKIKYISQENQGVSSANNTAILNAKGKYIAKMNGDDICYPHRLERQVQFIQETGAKIVFSWVDIIDDNSKIITDKHPSSKIFNRAHKNRVDILKGFFFKFNYINAVTGLMERELLREVGLYCLTSIQLQDFDMWIKLAKKYDIYMLPDKLLKYRIRANNNNLSASEPDKLSRSYFEFQQIYITFFDDFSMDLFKQVFVNEIKVKNFSSNIHYELEKAFIYLLHKTPHIQVIGLEKLYHLLQDQSILKIAKSDYNFGLPDFFELTKKFDFWNYKQLLFNKKKPKNQYEVALKVEVNNQLKTIFMLIDKNESSQQLILNYFKNNEFYKPEIWELFKEVLQQGDLFIDLASNVGYYSLLASILVGSNGSVWCLEPELYNQEAILENISLNKFTNIKLFKSGFMMSLDLLFFQEQISPNKLKLIKIETCGNEYFTLLGAFQVIKNSQVPYILVEIDLLALEKMGSSERQIRNLMYSWGYKTEILDSKSCKRIKLEPEMNIVSNYKFNILFSRKYSSPQ